MLNKEIHLTCTIVYFIYLFVIFYTVNRRGLNFGNVFPKGGEVRRNKQQCTALVSKNQNNKTLYRIKKEQKTNNASKHKNKKAKNKQKNKNK